MDLKQPQGLISVLLDRNAEFGDRDDAAMDLGMYDEEEAELALLAVASDSHTDPLLADSCGESLAEIWCRKGKVPRGRLQPLTASALQSAFATIKALRPSLLDEGAT